MFSTDSARKGTVPLTLLALAIPIFFIFLGANSIWDANEAFYVETPRQMVLSGDYINPSFNGLPRFNKPVLSYWIVAGLYHLFGVSVTVERIGIALGAMGIIAATFLIGRALRSPQTGVLAALLVATSPRFIMHARRIFIDIYVTLFMSLALACFVLAERDPVRRRRYLLLMYIAIGLGVLTKGPVALVLPALAGLAWLAVERRLSDLRRLMLIPGSLIVLAIVVPWYAAVYAQHGWTYIMGFFVGENVERYTTPMTPDVRGVLFYLPVLFTDLFPWAPLAIVPLVTIAATRIRQTPSATDSSAAIRRLLWLWIIVIIGVFTFSQTKQDLYILPVVPAVAVLVADVLVASNWGRSSRLISLVLVLVFVSCVALAWALHWLFTVPAAAWAPAGFNAFSVVLGASGLAGLVLWIRNKRQGAVLTLAAGFIVIDYLFVGKILPDVERLKPTATLARVLIEQPSPDARIGQFNMSLPSLVYYIQQPIEDLPSLEHASEFLRDKREGWIVTSASDWPEVHLRVPWACVVARHSLLIFNQRLDDLIRGTPPPEAVVITNKCKG